MRQCWALLDVDLVEALSDNWNHYLKELLYWHQSMELVNLNPNDRWINQSL